MNPTISNETSNPYSIDSNSQVFTASWDGPMWVLNAILLVFYGSLTLVFLLIGLSVLQNNIWAGITMLSSSLLSLLALAGPAGFAPRRYEIKDDAIAIKRLIPKDVRIPFSKVCSIEPTGYKHAFKNSLRIMGSGGGFGFYGSFTSQNLGRFQAYATRKSNCVLIRTQDRAVVVTPDDPDSFIAAVREKAGLKAK